MLAVERRNQIFEAFQGEIRPIALSVKKNLPPSISVDDLEQLGALGLLAAAEQYDDTRKDEFPFYAKVKIHGAMIDGVRGKEYRAATCDAIEPKLYQMPDRRSPQPDEILEAKQRRRAVVVAIDSLTPKQRKVIELRYSSGLTQKEAGERLGGISQQGAQDLEVRAITTLKRKLSGAKIIPFPAPLSAAA